MKLKETYRIGLVAAGSLLWATAASARAAPVQEPPTVHGTVQGLVELPSDPTDVGQIVGHVFSNGNGDEAEPLILGARLFGAEDMVSGDVGGWILGGDRLPDAFLAGAWFMLDENTGQVVADVYRGVVGERFMFLDTLEPSGVLVARFLVTELRQALPGGVEPFPLEQREALPLPPGIQGPVTVPPGGFTPGPGDPGPEPLPDDPGIDPLPDDPGADPLPEDPGADPLPEDPGADLIPPQDGADPLPPEPDPTEPGITGQQPDITPEQVEPENAPQTHPISTEAAMSRVGSLHGVVILN